MAGKAKKPSVDNEKIAELTADLQRVRADFENYRKRVEQEKKQASQNGETKTIVKLLPVIDTIERAVVHIPDDIAEHSWVQGVAGLVKQLDKTLSGLDLKRIPSDAGERFNPELHQAVQFDEDAEGEQEVVAEELQAGYTLHSMPIRHAMVKVTRK